MDPDLLELGKKLLQVPVLLQVAGILLSLFVSYIPKLREKWAAQDPDLQRLGMLISITVVTTIVGVLSFTNILPVVPPTIEGILLLIFSWISALVSNQTTYKLSPQVKTVKLVRAERDLKINGVG